MNHPFQTTISEEELIRRHAETVAAQRAAEQAPQEQPQPAPKQG